MKFLATEINGLYTIELEPFQDERGSFSRIFCRHEFVRANLKGDFVQTNHSVTKYRGTIRGLHYQLPPDMEIKVIRCVRGAIFDVAVDLRKNSPTFMSYFGVELSEVNNQMIYIPQGFAHGFQTLEDHSVLIYQHSSYYRPGSERGLKYNDPSIGIPWPIMVSTISEKDQNYIFLNDSFEGIDIL
jgi:dTDP-4-dehydrorhamnose 3,5-epimerase